MKRRLFIKMLPIGFVAARFGGLIELIRPKRIDFNAVELLRNRLERSTQIQEALLQPWFDEWIEKEGLQKVFNTPADPEYYKWRAKDLKDCLISNH